MSKLYTISRLLLGLIFLLFGANGLIYMTTGTLLIPIPPSTDEMKTVMGGLFAAKYLMPTVKVLELVSGIFLLSNKCVNLALTLIGPIVFNILFLHVFLNPAGIPMAVIMTLLWLVLVYQNRSAFKKLFCES